MTGLRDLGATGLRVSALGLGTVKIGRSTGVKYPEGYTLPPDADAARLLDLARDLGINLLDTAPAYGSSEQRLGRLLAGQRQHWLLCTKVGEQFDGQHSTFDFSPEHTRDSLHASLRRLATDYIDIALIHSNGEDLPILQHYGTLEALRELQRQGLIRAVGISSKTPAGALAATRLCDVVMLTYNSREQADAPALAACADGNCGALLKKVLGSGHLANKGADDLAASLRLALQHPGTAAAVLGTIDEAHLRHNVELAREILG